ncbi:hypothetical protein L202_07638 [Cryptococcus amylolentus CBS 6039]|uniref:Uncharacterized protein n=3 Tax=Cryptococcus amylolentus TaxID=104669 RepID=A0A1E3HCX0_9TREE|nr:hypothetical protein L202_07638 [Cryptococcus amylolentus CBS 6039]ODN74187.1 hypothetical protein L202_07638 [Cryptococcus amylolentus CBS 6039]
MLLRNRQNTAKPPNKILKKRRTAILPHEDVPTSPLPNFFTRLPPEIGAMIYDHIKLSASKSDIISLCCTSETTYLTFVSFLYESVRLSDRNVRAFFGDLCNDQPVSILCPRPGMDAEVLQRCLPLVSSRLLRKFINFNPYIQFVTLGYQSPSSELLASTSSLFKKILLCRFIKTIIIEDLTACHFFRHFSDLVYNRFRRFPFYEPEESVYPAIEFGFEHVEWLVFSKSFTEDVEKQWNDGGAAMRTERWYWAEVTVRHVAPRRVCAWAFADDRAHMVSELGVGWTSNRPQLKQFVLHNAHFCTQLLPLPAEHIEYYLQPEKAGCSHVQSISNGLPYMFAVPGTDRHHDIHSIRCLEIHNASITQHQVVDILEKSHDSASKAWNQWKGTLVVDGKGSPAKSCDGCELEARRYCFESVAFLRF